MKYPRSEDTRIVAGSCEITKADLEREFRRQLETPIKVLTTPEVEAMVDLETLDTTPTSAVFQAAIVFFDKTHTIIYRETWNINVDEQLARFRTVSASTLAFHLGNPENVKAALEDEEAVSVGTFVRHLIDNIQIYKPKMIWTKGNFDCNILQTMFNDEGLNTPWNFRQICELRTLMREIGVKRGEVSHNALEDCTKQVAQLAECRGRIEHGSLVYDMMVREAKAELESPCDNAAPPAVPERLTQELAAPCVDVQDPNILLIAKQDLKSTYQHPETPQSLDPEVMTSASPRPDVME